MTTVEKIYNEFLTQKSDELYPKNYTVCEVRDLLKEAIYLAYAEITKGHRVQVKMIGVDEGPFEPVDWDDLMSHPKAEAWRLEGCTFRCELYDNLPNEKLGWKEMWIVYQVYPNGDEVPFCYTSDDISKIER